MILATIRADATVTPKINCFLGSTVFTLVCEETATFVLAGQHLQRIFPREKFQKENNYSQNTWTRKSIEHNRGKEKKITEKSIKRAIDEYRQVYDTTALLSISLIKKLHLLRILDIVAFVPVSVMEELSDIGKYRDELGDAAKEVIMSDKIERGVRE